MKTLKLVKKFGIHAAGSEIEANEVLEKHLLSGGFVEVVEEEPKPKRKPKK